MVSACPVTREAGAARLALRWTAPSLTSYRRIPARYLLPDDASAGTRRWHSLALAGRRVGTAVLVVLVVVRLASFTIGRLGRRAVARPGA